MSYTVQELETAMLAYQNWSEWSWVDGDDEGVNFPGIGRVRSIDESDNDDWSGEIYFVVEVSHEDGSVAHFRKDGFYYSHDGSYWDGGFYPAVQKTQTVKVWVRA